MDLDGLCEDLGAAPAKFVIILHAHNHTGLDPTKEQWEKIMKICRYNQHFPFFYPPKPALNFFPNVHKGLEVEIR